MTERYFQEFTLHNCYRIFLIENRSIDFRFFSQSIARAYARTS